MKTPKSKSLFRTALTDALNAELARGRTRFHVPFHAGTNLTGNAMFSEILALDYTELPALDVLGHPEGVLKESQEATAELFGVDQSFYLINGASVGLMASLLSAGCAHQDGAVLMARNAHRSVIHGLILAGGIPGWFLPESLQEWGVWGEINPDKLAQTFEEHPEIRVFVMTHPTYEGIASPIRDIADVCRRYGVCLVVDEAHGGLWPLFETLPTSAIEAGADAVIHSSHKSVGSLTQTALLHLPKGSCLKSEAVQEALNVLQTTSPSYPLLVHLEQTLSWVASDVGKNRITDHLTRVQALQCWVSEHLTSIHVLPQNLADGTFQLFLKSDKLSGEALGERLEETYDLSYEAVTPYGVLMGLNLGLPDSAFEALKAALLEIEDETLALPDYFFGEGLAFQLPTIHCSPREAFFASGEVMDSSNALGRVSRQVVAACPPGIPVLIPGEIIQESHLPFLGETILVVS